VLFEAKRKFMFIVSMPLFLNGLYVSFGFAMSRTSACRLLLPLFHQYQQHCCSAPSPYCFIDHHFVCKAVKQ
jgi:hypothetical protein